MRRTPPATAVGRSVRRVLAGLCFVLGWGPAGDFVRADPGSAGGGDALCDLVRQLQARELAPGDESELRRAACQALLDAFSTGGRVLATGQGPEGGSANPQPGLQAAESVGGRFGCLRVGTVEGDLPGALTEAHARLPASTDGGTVLDLRDASGNGLAAADQSAAVLGSWGRPLVVIVSGRTRGAAEVLAARLREKHGAVLLGEATRGLPFAMRAVQIAGSIEVLLPDVPAGARPEPLLPDVPFAGKAGETPAEHPWQGRSRGAEARDDCVRQALDLLTAICTFRQKHF